MGDYMSSVAKETRFASLFDSPGEATLLLLFVVLFLPSSFYVRPSGHLLGYHLIALTWEVLFYRDGRILFRIELDAIAMLLYIFLKYLLVFQFYRYCKGLTTRKRVLILAVLSELQMLVTSEIIRIIGNSSVWNPSDLSIPIPLALIACAVLLRVLPDQESERIWVETDKQSQ